MEKEKITKQLIIETAFTEWGKKGFSDLTLTLISEKLQVSKAALYKHFSSKEAILKEMVRISREELTQKTVLFIEEAENSEELIQSYIKIFVAYFTEQPYRLFFYNIIAPHASLLKEESMCNLRNKQITLFAQYIETKYNKTDSYFLGESLLYYVSTTMILYLNFKFYRKLYNEPELIIYANEIEAYIKEVIEIVFHGFSTINKDFRINYEEIEKQSFIIPEDLKKRDTILDAIADVTAEEGVWNVTIDKIAKKLGKAKSTLYLYFKNKNEMIAQMIEQEFITFSQIYHSKTEQYTIFHEKLYSYICCVFSHLLIDTKLLRIMNWIHFQNINIKDFKNIMHSLYDFFFIAMTDKKLRIFSNSKSFPIIFLNAHISKEIVIYRYFNKKQDRRSTRLLYNLFLNGIEGGLSW